MTLPKTAPTFDRWAEGARPRLLRLITPMLGQRHEAEDVVQETLLALWKRHEKVQDWDAYAARAAWLNALKRKERRRPWVPLEDAHGHGAGLWDASMQPWELERAIGGLPPPQQAVIRLRFYAGASFHEIGETLEISLNTAASRCRYALEALRQALHIQTSQGGKGGKQGD